MCLSISTQLKNSAFESDVPQPPVGNFGMFFVCVEEAELVLGILLVTVVMLAITELMKLVLGIHH